MIVELIAAAVIALAPPGFTEAKKLEAAASAVAGKPVQVWCAKDNIAMANAEMGMADVTEGFTTAGASTAYLSSRACVPMLVRLAHRRADDFDFALGLLTLVHESVHMSGISDESQTDCSALRLMPNIGRRFFGMSHAAIHAMMGAAWDIHYGNPPRYRTDC